MNDAPMTVDVLLTGKTLPNADIDQAAAAFAKMGGIAPEKARALITGGKPKLLWSGLSAEKGLAVTSRFASMGIEAIMRPSTPAKPATRETPQQQPAAPQPARPAQSAQPQQAPPRPQAQAEQPAQAQQAPPQPQAAQTAQAGASGAAHSGEDYYRAAIGKNADYYLGKFKQIKDWTMTGNIAAFFFMSPWLIYRKMYLYFFLYIIIALPIQFVLGVLLGILMMKAGMALDDSMQIGASLLYGLSVSLLLMGIANALYKKHIEKKIREAKVLCATPEETVAHLERVGGTNVVGCVIGCIVGFLFIAAVGVLNNTLENIQMHLSTASPKAAVQNDLKVLQKKAVQGDANAQTLLGGRYVKGEGVPQDDRQAVEWWRKAADQGNADAQFLLGLMYDSGRGVTQDYHQAVELYRKAAAQGLAGAQYKLGAMYNKGLGVAQDYRQAAEWFLKAAAQGDTDAQRNLGMMYLSGRGMVQDDRLAEKWFKEAASQGDEDARQWLRNMGVQ